MSWFRVSGGRLEYRGRITREPFTAWTATADGNGAVTAAAGEMRIRFGSRLRARRQMWRALERATREEPVRSAIRLEADRFVSAMTSVSYAAALPRAQVALRRLVVVPRTMVVGRARAALCQRLARLDAMQMVPDAVQIFFHDRLLKEMNQALQQARPSPRHPVAAHDGWTCVGVDPQFLWVDPLWAGDAWTGHVFMFEMPSSGLSRKHRLELESTIERMRAQLPALSRIQRDGVIRNALEACAAVR